jgi:hypothetical protein
MLNIRSLSIDPASLGETMLLVDVLPTYEYVNGARTEKLSGYRYVVALPAHQLEKLSVKIPGRQLIDRPNGYIEVEFSDLFVRPYESQGHVLLSATATGITEKKV